MRSLWGDYSFISSASEFSHRVSGVGVGAGVEQQPHHLAVSAPRGQVQGSPPALRTCDITPKAAEGRCDCL